MSFNELFEMVRDEFASIDSVDVRDKLEHINRVVSMAESVAKEDQLLVECAKFHDILGRAEQYKHLSRMEGVGPFEDSVLDHHALAENAIRRFVYQGKWEAGFVADCIRAVALYHGPEKFMPEYIKNADGVEYYVQAISVLDDIDNGCMGALSYMEREILGDAKAQMLSKSGGTTMEIRSSGVVSDSVVEHFRKLEKFDKMRECKTYADYLVFAIIIGFQFLTSEYEDIRELVKRAIATPCGKYASANDGYNDLIQKFICLEQREEIWNIFTSHIDKNGNGHSEKRFFS